MQCPRRSNQTQSASPRLSRHHPQSIAQCFVLMRGATADTAGALRVWRQSREVIQPPNGLNFYSQLNTNLLAQAAKNLLLVALKMLEVRHMFQPQLLPLKPCDATRRVSPNCQPLRPRIRSAVTAFTVKSCKAPTRHCLTHAGERVSRCRMVYDRVCA